MSEKPKFFEHEENRLGDTPMAEKLDNQENGPMGGEYLVTPEGDFTYAREYQHPKTGQTIKLIGMSHYGDKEYMEQVADILKECDLVIYEGPFEPPTEAGELEEKEKQKEMDKNLFGANLDEAFRGALSVYEAEILKYLPHINERYFFDETQPNWIGGETKWWKKDQSPEGPKELENKIHEEIARIPDEYKLEYVILVRKKVEHIRRRHGVTAQDVFEFFKIAGGKYFQKENKIFNDMVDRLNKERHLELEQTLDRVLSERNPKMLGIKYGAYHTAWLRPRIEARGFVLKNSTPLKATSFDKLDE